MDIQGNPGFILYTGQRDQIIFRASTSCVNAPGMCPNGGM